MKLFHVPLNMGKVVTRMFKKIQDAGAAPSDEDFLVLAYDPSPWKSELHMTVTNEVSDARIVKFTGTFISKVFEGSYKDVPKWFNVMQDYASKKGLKFKKQYFHFAYCPKCSKKYGKNYAIAFGEVY
ncbi:hypothetical protein KJ918_07460 [Patescibacteria group bacterium]|nr:hypothetical protein [Patescibacteria group bacterium]